MGNIIIVKNSSNIRKLEYLNDNLRVEFLNGSIYEYEGVPKKLFESFYKLSDSDSFGKYFIENIKDRYPFKKIKSGIKVVIHK